MIKVKSSLIAAVDYDEETQRLVVEFKGGGTYVYSSVSQGIYRGLIGAKSVGKYFQTYIKGTFPFEKAE